MKPFFNDEEIMICVRKCDRYFLKKFTLDPEDQVEIIPFERELVIQKNHPGTDKYQLNLFKEEE